MHWWYMSFWIYYGISCCHMINRKLIFTLCRSTDHNAEHFFNRGEYSNFGSCCFKSKNFHWCLKRMIKMPGFLWIGDYCMILVESTLTHCVSILNQYILFNESYRYRALKFKEKIHQKTQKLTSIGKLHNLLWIILVWITFWSLYKSYVTWLLICDSYNTVWATEPMWYLLSIRCKVHCEKSSLGDHQACLCLKRPYKNHDQIHLQCLSTVCWSYRSQAVES